MIKLKSYLLLIFLFQFFEMNAQVLDYFGQSQKWSGGSYAAYVENMAQDNSGYSMFVIGDTTINSNLYYKIYSNGYSSYSEYGQIIYGSSYDTTLSYLFRQIDRKIYYWDSSSNQDSLWVDYGLNIGDTIGGYMGANNTYWIDSIDSISLDFEYHRRLWLNDFPGTDNPVLIEGVGFFTDTTGTSGSFFRINPIGFGTGSYLSCYAKNDTTLYPNPQSNCDYDSYVEGIGIDNNEKINAKIYPNPTSDFLKIESESNPDLVEIYSLNGELLKRLERRNKLLDLSMLESGVYILKLEFDEGLVHRKVIISK